MKKVFIANKYNDLTNFFVKNGFCVVRGIYSKSKIISLEKLIKNYQKIFLRINKNNRFDDQSFAISSHRMFERSELCDYFYKNENLIDLLSKFYGNDIVKINFSRFQINKKIEKKNSNNQIKSERKFSQFLGIHNDHWTGSSEYTLHYWMPFSGLDSKNGMTLYPGSHLNGSFPVYNRQIDPKIDFKYKPHILSYIKSGDVLLFHSLLLHKTTGKSKRTRMAELARFTNINYRMTNQEKDLGFQTLSIGPMRQIIRINGNDSLTPFRTYGGEPGIDRVVKEVYDKSKMDFKSKKLLDYFKNSRE